MLLICYEYQKRLSDLFLKSVLMGGGTRSRYLLENFELSCLENLVDELL
jgi:hypothetical protein